MSFLSYSKKVLAIALAGICVMGTADAAIKSKLIVGTEAGYAPFEYLDSKGNIVGFDKDLMDYLCAKMKVQCVMQNTAFDSLIPNVKYNKFDMVMAGIHPTDARKKVVAFTKPYLPSSQLVYLTAKDKNFKSVEQLKKVGSQNGTLQTAYLKEKTNKTVVGYDTYDLAILDLKAGRVEAVLTTTDVSKEMMAKYSGIAVTGKPFHDAIMGAGPSIAVNKKNQELIDTLNKYIAEAEKDGTIAKLVAKYNMDK